MKQKTDETPPLKHTSLHPHNPKTRVTTCHTLIKHFILCLVCFLRGLFLWLYKIPVYFSQSSLESVVGQCFFGTFLFDFYCCLNIFSLQKLKSLHLFFCLFFSCCTSKQTVNTWAAHSDTLWIYCSLFWHSLTVEKLENDTHAHIHTKKEAASLLSGRFICSSVLMFWK